MKKLILSIFFFAICFNIKSAQKLNLIEKKTNICLQHFNSWDLNQNLVYKDGYIYKVEGKRMILSGVVLKYIWKTVTPYLIDFIKNRIRTYFVDKGLKIYSSDNNEIEAVNLKVTGNDGKYSIVSSCEDHDGDGEFDHTEKEEFDEDDKDDMVNDIDKLCDEEFEFFNQYYEE